MLSRLKDCVLPDGPAARGAATSWRVYRSGDAIFRGPALAGIFISLARALDLG
jgi:hypothetical protein